MELLILTNPRLDYLTQVVLTDGRKGRLSDAAIHLRTRQIDVDGVMKIQKIHVKQIETACAHGIWYKCQWD